MNRDDLIPAAKYRLARTPKGDVPTSVSDGEACRRLPEDRAPEGNDLRAVGIGPGTGTEGERGALAAIGMEGDR
jgi:hypothetical protein